MSQAQPSPHPAPAGLADLGLNDARRLLLAGEISSSQLTQACLERIQRHDPRLHTCLALDPTGALSAAAQADRRLAAWRLGQDPSPLPPLLGLPLLVKDVFCVQGLPCTCGSRILENFIPPYDATAVARLRQAGMVVLGKTNTDEFAMGSSTENSAYGATRNPWDPDRVPGGSSGGSAAAVAAHFVPAALGSDTGGSVRQPASFCGVTGLKPTYGRISRYGLVAFASSLDTVGAFARSAADVALVYSQMAGGDPLDATSVDLPRPQIELPADLGEKPLAGLRLGAPAEYFAQGVHPEVVAAVRQGIEVLVALGAQLVEISLPHTAYALPVYYLLAPAEASANLARYDGIRFGPRQPGENLAEIFSATRGEKFGAEVKRRIMLGTYALSAGYYDAYYGRAQKVRTLIRRDFTQAFEQVDLIAAPVCPNPAFKLGEHGDDPLAMYMEDILTIPANLAGIPALAFPAGFDHQGLPLGMQLMGAPFSEELLLRTAHAYQQATTWQRHAPRPTF